MVIRRDGQRRRRVVIDEVSNNRDEKKTVSRARTDSQTVRNKKTDKSRDDSRLYSFGADRRGQPKTTDFLPKRFLPFACVVLLLVASIGVINLLASYAPTWQSVIGDAGLRTFSLTGVGSLSSWFSSFLLIITGLASLQIYALRQHRCDDYRGTYRLWLWMALLFMLASIHCVVDLASVLQNAASAIMNQPVGEKVWALLAFKLVALSLLFVRGLFEVKESRGAFTMVVIVWLAYTSATVLQIPALKNSLVVDYNAVYGNLILFATTMLLLSQLTYARFVFMQANGLIRLKVAKERVANSGVMSKTDNVETYVGKSDAESTAKNTKASRKKTARQTSKQAAPATPETAVPVTKSKVRPPVPKPKRKIPPVPAPSKPVAKKQTAAVDNESEAQAILAITPEQYAKMSKADRRRHRKLEKRQRRAA